MGKLPTAKQWISLLETEPGKPCTSRFVQSCDHCEHEYLLAFSCKSRCLCPSCHQKNVQTTARFILDQVVAPAPHRHYVLAHLAFKWLEGGSGVA